jgi:hypothetical protein
MAPRSVRFGVQSRKLSNVGQSRDGCPNKYFLELLRASEGTLSRWSRLNLKSLAPTNPHCARVVGYGPFFLWVIHKEGLCPSNGDINRLMMTLKSKINMKKCLICFILEQDNILLKLLMKYSADWYRPIAIGLGCKSY